jgi:SAM-dependent methyltransferase
LICFSFSWALTIYMGRVLPAQWSPYYRVTTSPLSPDGPYAIGVSVNYDGFQAIQLLTPAHLAKFPEAVQKAASRHYNLPYRLSQRPIESVLILGGGTGNDAAAALRNGATQVDVVEIDPVTARIGREQHPEHPYASRYVHLHVDDARSFLQKTEQKYDLVVFATLDSHTAFSSLSSIRLDNFVFTKDSIEQVRSRLKAGGGIALNFFAVNPWLSQRHVNTLMEAMGNAPVAFGSIEGTEEVLLLAGDLFDPNRDLGITNYQPLSLPFTSSKVEPTSDDWPFLFLERRGIPFHYLLPLLLIFVMSLAPFRYCQARAGDMNWHLFFMGASFLLIETKSVTSLGLLFGSTWMVNSVVIGSILVMILFANTMIASGLKISFTTLYGVLFAVLLVNFFFPLDLLNGLTWVQRVVAGGLMVSAPLFVAAIIFAKAFSRVRSPSIALASNLFGALIGGLLEYADMWTGLRWLNIIALCLYFFSYLALLKVKGMDSSVSPTGQPVTQ